MDKQHFVKTRSKEIAEELERNGFTFLGESGGIFSFINNGRVTFSNEEKREKGIVCDNIITL